MSVSYSQADITSKNNANESSQFPSREGWKLGGGRAEFTATGGKAIAAHGLGLTIPKGATITRVIYKTLTTFTSATDAATIALHIVAANDVVTAVAISDGGNPWDAGIPKVTTPVTATASTWLHTTADSELTATVAVEALTAGKLVVFVEWVYWGDLSLT